MTLKQRKAQKNNSHTKKHSQCLKKKRRKVHEANDTKREKAKTQEYIRRTRDKEKEKMRNEKWNPILYFTRAVHMCMTFLSPCARFTVFKMQYNECFPFDI